MYQEKKEEEDLPAFNIALMHRCKDSINKRGGRLIKAIRNNTDNISTKRIEINRKQKWDTTLWTLQATNNSMDTSNDKQL